MDAIIVPILFTVLAVAIGCWILSATSRITRNWSIWDTVFVTLLVSAVVITTWMVFFYHYWYIAFFFSVGAMLLARYVPALEFNMYTRNVAQIMRGTLAGAVICTAWGTWFILLCEELWSRPSLIL